MPRRAAAAARIEQPPLDQPPVAHRCRCPFGLIGARAERAQLLLPLALRVGRVTVHLDTIEQPRRTARVHQRSMR